MPRIFFASRTRRLIAPAATNTAAAALLAALLSACAASDPQLEAALADSHAQPRRAVLALAPYAALGQARAIAQLCVAYGRCIDSETGQAERLSARQWCQRAASAGNAQAQYVLGTFHAQGIGTPVDPAQALSWFQRASDQGHAQATRAVRSLQGLPALCINPIMNCRLF